MLPRLEPGGDGDVAAIPSSQPHKAAFEGLALGLHEDHVLSVVIDQRAHRDRRGAEVLADDKMDTGEGT